MIFDLFETGTSNLQSIPIEDGEISFLEKFPLPFEYEVVFQQLISDTPWRAEQIKIWGKTHIQPRLVAWYGDPGKSYTYSGNTFTPLPWTQILIKIKDKIEQLTDKKFNSVLLNYYRNNSDSMGFHSDNEKELGETPSIASLSLGASRVFILKHKFKKELKPIRIKLNNGNFILMSGDTQKNWDHGISKETKECGPRINLTYRNIF